MKVNLVVKCHGFKFISFFFVGFISFLRFMLLIICGLIGTLLELFHFWEIMVLFD